MIHLAETPPETISFITSPGSAVRGMTLSLATTIRFPAKLYAWGRYTVILSWMPMALRFSLVAKPSSLILLSFSIITWTGR